MSRLSVTVVALALTGTLMGTPAEAVQRAFVASYGSDANVGTLCGLANPCRSFATAVTVVDPNGEVLALDSIGYGAVTLTQSISLVAAPGVYAGISVSSGNGVTIATPGISVTLRGLTINGIGGSNGVAMTNGTKLSIENCVISNFPNAGGAGVVVNTAAKVGIVDSLIRDSYYGALIQGGASADIANSTISGSSFMGIVAQGSVASTTTTAVVTNTVVRGNNFGIASHSTNVTGLTRVSVIRSTSSNNGATAFLVQSDAGASAVLNVSSSLAAGNGFGFVQSGSSATLETSGNNTVRQNGTNASGTITTVSTI